MKTKILSLLLLLAGMFLGHSQGFINLDFERGYTLTNFTVTIPGWTASPPYILTRDDVSLSGGDIAIWDTNSVYNTRVIQGTYFIEMDSVNLTGINIPISLGQTGRVPTSAESISFWGAIGEMQVTFNNQALDFLVTGNASNFSIYSADISAFAGQTGQLLFTMQPLTGSAILDNIQFSPSSVPEPGALSLSALGALFLAWHRRKK